MNQLGAKGRLKVGVQLGNGLAGQHHVAAAEAGGPGSSGGVVRVHVTVAWARPGSRVSCRECRLQQGHWRAARSEAVETWGAAADGRVGSEDLAWLMSAAAPREVVTADRAGLDAAGRSPGIGGLRSAQPGTASASPDRQLWRTRRRLWLAGRRLRPGDVARLGRGRTTALGGVTRPMEALTPRSASQRQQRLGAAARSESGPRSKSSNSSPARCERKHFVHAAADRLAQHLGGGGDVLIPGRRGCAYRWSI